MNTFAGGCSPPSRVAVGLLEASFPRLRIVIACVAVLGPGSQPQAADRTRGPGLRLVGSVLDQVITCVLWLVMSEGARAWSDTVRLRELADRGHLARRRASPSRLGPLPAATSASPVCPSLQVWPDDRSSHWNQQSRQVKLLKKTEVLQEGAEVCTQTCVV